MQPSERPEMRPVDPETARAARPVHRWLYVLLLIPFVGTLWVSLYARDEPKLFGFPFFYWYQLAWVFAAAGITAFVYLLTTPRRAGPRPGDGGDAVYPASPRPSGERSRQT